jgi:predicted nucleotidyltransferase
MSTLFSKERIRIVENVLDNPSRKTKVRELAKQLELSPAHISRTLKILAENKLLKENAVDLSNPYVRVLKTFLNIRKLHERNVVGMLRRLGVVGAGVYGSWFNGSNHEDSDLDIWIKVRKHPGERRIAAVANDMRKVLGRSVQILVLTPERVNRLKREDPIFYYSLVYGSLTLCGESVE